MHWVPWMVVALVTTVVPVRALACLCAVPNLRVPAAGAVDVPLNTSIWVGRFVLPDTLTLTISGVMESVPMTCADLGRAVRCRPITELRPLTRYRIEELQSEFTTGSSRDDAAPGPPSETARRYHASSGLMSFRDACDPEGPSGAVELTMEGVETILVVDTSGGADPGAPSGPVTEVLERNPDTPDMDVWIGTWTCKRNLAAEPGDRFPLRVGAFDVAGNFSGWVQLKDAAIPYAASGCSSSTADGVLRMVFLLVVLAVGRRRMHGA